jgi:hypothetical protein
VAAQVLGEFGIELAAARTHVLRILSSGKQDDDGFPRRTIIEALTRDAGVAGVFATQGIDAGILIAELRSAALRPHAPGAGDGPRVAMTRCGPASAWVFDRRLDLSQLRTHATRANFQRQRCRRSAAPSGIRAPLSSCRSTTTAPRETIIELHQAAV